MHAGRVEQASALARRINKWITSRNKRRLCADTGKIEAKDMCAVVRQLTGRKQIVGAFDGVNAATLNAHYAAISTDPDYNTPTHKLSASQSFTTFISEWEVFKALDTLRLQLLVLTHCRPGSYDWVHHCFVNPPHSYLICL